MNEMEYSLFKLLSKYEICIPTIQREYVQGSNEEKIEELRKNLLNDIFNTLESDYKKLKLNIIYGLTDTKENGNKIFYPLDGQQRLTTLYILHWYLSIIQKEKLPLNNFTYEIRYSANSFFRELVNEKKSSEFYKLLKGTDKEKFIKSIKSKKWFKTQWFNDITVLAILNIIGDIIETKIEDKKCKSYYEKLRSNDCPIYFDFLTEDSKESDSYKDAAINYIRMNSRGKQLEAFENIKARLEIIEKNSYKEEKGFTWYYDRKFIDLFYNRALNEKTLEEKNKKINEETINMLINLYNLLVIRSGKHEGEERIIKKGRKQCISKDDYYDIIYSASREAEKEDQKFFWREYFEFLEVIMNSLCKDTEIIRYIENIFKEQNPYNTNSKICDSDNTIAYLMYIFYYYKTQDCYVNKESIEKLKYVLENLNYSKWRQNCFKEIELFVQNSTVFENVIEYFVAREYDEVIKTLELEDNRLEIDDIKVRIKEQCIKAKIIYKINNESNSSIEYNYFNRLELQSRCRKIQYLLFISDMWDNVVTIEKIRILLEYIRIAKMFFCINSNVLLWRKFFAIAVNWKDDKLNSSETINEGVNLKYINEKKEFIDEHNIWYWEDDYYFITDDISKNRNTLVKYKMKELKKAYEFLIKYNFLNDKDKNISINKEKLIEWLNTRFDSSYDTCWLKYAIDRDYEDIFINKIQYNKEKRLLYIQIPAPKKYHYSEQQYEFVNLFARIYSLDKENDKWCININYDKIWDYDGKRIASYTMENGIIYDDFFNNSVINQFGLELLWSDHYQQYIKNNRYFFFYNWRVRFEKKGNTLISFENGKVVIREFFNQNIYKEYEYDFVNSQEKNLIDSYLKSFDETKKLIEVYYKEESALPEYYDIWKLYRAYEYNFETIKKCRYNKDFELNVDISKFSKKSEGKTLQFKKLKNQVIKSFV